MQAAPLWSRGLALKVEFFNLDTASQKTTLKNTHKKNCISGDLALKAEKFNLGLTSAIPNITGSFYITICDLNMHSFKGRFSVSKT